MQNSSKEKIICTVGILTYNSGKTLRRALESVKDFSEIIICDGGSTDDTLTIAREYGAQVLQQDKKYIDDSGHLDDFAGVRNQCLEASTHDWFFFLDSDEYCGEDLVLAIAEAIQKNNIGAYFINRKYIRDGIVIDCATTYPNRQMRFFARVSVNKFIKKVHERIQMKEGVSALILPGILYIPFEITLEEVRKKWDYYISLEVARYTPLTWGVIRHVALLVSRVSLLYFIRLLRIWVTCRSTRMPLLFELERHRYHLRLMAALLKAKLRL